MTGEQVERFSSLTIKLGSLVRHYEEAMSPGGHDFDLAAIDQMTQDPEIVAWMQEADRLALLPVKRSP